MPATPAPPLVRARGLRQQFGAFTALDDVDFELQDHTIYGLLGRNGAGKTTLMQILTGQTLPSSGRIEVFGTDPYESAAIMQQMCFVADTQRYPDAVCVRHVLSSAELLVPRWDSDYAHHLVERFALPENRRVKKLSRGMTSALGIVVGLASRAPLTVFDEPYLGLDAVARKMFYDELIADYAEHPRTIVLSTHLIDEVADLLEHVLVLDRGRLVLDVDTDTARASAAVAEGPADDVARVVGSHTVLHHESLGNTVRTTFLSGTDGIDETGRPAGVSIHAVSLQDLVVHLHVDPTTESHARTTTASTTQEAPL
ncbi:ABC transporter ATP-binding protein [Rhodococcus artemisiae]|uniref:ABC transporter ATP-binding protein n=1 Tax=Rhodococcus artemisiae TaxID=714159 RepID=A0ABU7L6C1_9NOCA|nr:ABC transporter ATP-binding protein [Rhodococcus artemisiae]MEE2056457.1 ABC transporter ATP-binding protein [Rhodococcus artemisiae]